MYPLPRSHPSANASPCSGLVLPLPRLAPVLELLRIRGRGESDPVTPRDAPAESRARDPVPPCTSLWRTASQLEKQGELRSEGNVRAVASLPASLQAVSSSQATLPDWPLPRGAPESDVGSERLPSSSPRQGAGIEATWPAFGLSPRAFGFLRPVLSDWRARTAELGHWMRAAERVQARAAGSWAVCPQPVVKASRALVRPGRRSARSAKRGLSGVTSSPEGRVGEGPP